MKTTKGLMMGASILGLFDRARQSIAAYPRQFWVLFCGTFVGMAGINMIWPFMSLYAREEFGVPVTTVTLVLTLFYVTSAVATAGAGWVADRFGRKGGIVLGQAATCLVLLGMSAIGGLVAWAVLMIVWAIFWSLYRVASNAMVADLLTPERRAGAYALVMVAAGAGTMLGTSSGGYITGASYTLAFYIAAAAAVAFGLLILLLVPRTAPPVEASPDRSGTGSGYARILRDWPFLVFCGAQVLIYACNALLWLLPIYAKENFGVSERQYGFIMTAHSAMTVLLQYSITRIAEKLPRLPVLVVGALFYALGVGGVAWGWDFWTFTASVLVMTVGMLIVGPTSTALTADLAPADMRGRYLGVQNIAITIGLSVGPVVGGYLNDEIAPVATWYGGLVFGVTAALIFGLLARAMSKRVQVEN